MIRFVEKIKLIPGVMASLISHEYGKVKIPLKWQYFVQYKYTKEHSGKQIDKYFNSTLQM